MDIEGFNELDNKIAELLVEKLCKEKELIKKDLIEEVYSIAGKKYEVVMLI